MIEVNPLVLILLSEAVGILVIILGVMSFLGLRRKSRDTRGIRGLISNFASQAEVRKAALVGVIEDREGLQGEALEARVGEIVAAERHFLQNFIRLYRQRNAAAVSQMCVSIQALVAPYIRLEGAAASISVNAPALEAADSPNAPGFSPTPTGLQLQALEAENGHLTDELEHTRNDLRKMLEGSSFMFGDEAETDDLVLVGGEGGAGDPAAPGDLVKSGDDDDLMIVTESAGDHAQEDETRDEAGTRTDRGSADDPDGSVTQTGDVEDSLAELFHDMSDSGDNLLEITKNEDIEDPLGELLGETPASNDEPMVVPGNGTDIEDALSELLGETPASNDELMVVPGNGTDIEDALSEPLGETPASDDEPMEATGSGRNVEDALSELMDETPASDDEPMEATGSGRNVEDALSELMDETPASDDEPMVAGDGTDIEDALSELLGETPTSGDEPMVAAGNGRDIEDPLDELLGQNRAKL